MLQISKKSIRDAIQVLIDKDLIHKKRGAGYSPYLMPEDFEAKKDKFLSGLK